MQCRNLLLIPFLATVMPRPQAPPFLNSFRWWLLLSALLLPLVSGLAQNPPPPQPPSTVREKPRTVPPPSAPSASATAPNQTTPSVASPPTVNHYLANGFSTTATLKSTPPPTPVNPGFPARSVAPEGSPLTLNPATTATTGPATPSDPPATLGFSASSQSHSFLGPAYDNIRQRYRPGELLGPRANPGPGAGDPSMVRFLQKYNPFAPAEYGSGAERAAAHEALFGEIPSPVRRWP